MKGHPGAQSGVSWYYETGRGMPAPDLMEAYTWYVLSAIGGDPDAAISQEEVIKKMTPEEIKQAHVLIDDYSLGFIHLVIGAVIHPDNCFNLNFTII